MKALVIYDSFFGNTEKIALAIGDGLSSQADVVTLRVGDLKSEHLTGVDLLVVGSPTRAFSASSATKARLKALAPRSLAGVKVAAFDTRIAVEEAKSHVLPVFVKLFGYAAEPIANSLTKRGGTLVVPAEGFIVKDSEDPLREGELERAAAWAGQLVARM